MMWVSYISYYGWRLVFVCWGIRLFYRQISIWYDMLGLTPYLLLIFHEKWQDMNPAKNGEKSYFYLLPERHRKSCVETTRKAFAFLQIEPYIYSLSCIYIYSTINLFSLKWFLMILYAYLLIYRKKGYFCAAFLESLPLFIMFISFLFFGNRMRNVEAAIEAGFRGFQFKGVDLLRNDLSTLGVDISSNSHNENQDLASL